MKPPPDDFPNHAQKRRANLGHPRRSAPFSASDLLDIPLLTWSELLDELKAERASKELDARSRKN